MSCDRASAAPAAGPAAHIADLPRRSGSDTGPRCDLVKPDRDAPSRDCLRSTGCLRSAAGSSTSQPTPAHSPESRRRAASASPANRRRNARVNAVHKRTSPAVFPVAAAARSSIRPMACRNDERGHHDARRRRESAADRLGRVSSATRAPTTQQIEARRPFSNARLAKIGGRGRQVDGRHR